MNGKNYTNSYGYCNVELASLLLSPPIPPSSLKAKPLIGAPSSCLCLLFAQSAITRISENKIKIANC